MFLEFFILAIVIFIGFRIVNFITWRFKLYFNLKDHLLHIVPVIELLTWIAYAIWIAKVIYDANHNFALISIGIFFVLTAFPLFILIRDFVIGVLLKLQNKIVEGADIDIEDIKGVVKEAGYLRFDIEDRHGNITSIPYHYIYAKRISRSGNNHHLEKVTIHFEFLENSKSKDLIERLKKEVLNTPWVALSEPPVIENTNVENGKIMVDVRVFLLDKTNAENVKASVYSCL